MMGVMPEMPVPDGSEAQGQNPNGQQQPQLPPDVQKNDEVFKGVMKQFLASEGGQSAPAQQETAIEEPSEEQGGMDG